MTPIRDDFRSDTVTRPSAGHARRRWPRPRWATTCSATIRRCKRLEAMLAERLGKPAAVFMTSGTQSNLAALLAHCGRGDGYIAGMDAHCYAHEQGGRGVDRQPAAAADRRTSRTARWRWTISRRRSSRRRSALWRETRLLALENTFGGRVMPLTWIAEATALARKHGLGTHLDGARVFNAAVAGNVDVAEIAKPFDTISVCLSKGLGAPVGTVLVGRDGADRQGAAAAQGAGRRHAAGRASSRRPGSMRSSTMSSGWPRTTPMRGGWPTGSRRIPALTVTRPRHQHRLGEGGAGPARRRSATIWRPRGSAITGGYRRSGVSGSAG